MRYKSKHTGFIAHEKPYINKIYFKYCNTTAAIITVDDNWNMYGEVVSPFDMPVTTFSLNQVECENLILDFLPTWRVDVKQRSGLKEYDSAMLLYIYRGITRLNKWWFAWSEAEKIEDFHPEYTPELDPLRGIIEEDADFEIDQIEMEGDPIEELLEQRKEEISKEYTDYTFTDKYVFE